MSDDVSGVRTLSTYHEHEFAGPLTLLGGR